MYKINKDSKQTEKIQEVTFESLGITERYDIQEWVAKNPSILEYDSELLIIQKEFDGFQDTNRRLDLLALDSNGNLVIIENKRDDTGTDVTWQLLIMRRFVPRLPNKKLYQYTEIIYYDTKIRVIVMMKQSKSLMTF